MTCLAWDGRFLAADKMASNGNTCRTTTKIRRIKRVGHMVEVIGITGELDSGLLLMQWYENGADPKDWPDCQKDNDRWSRLVVADKTGCWQYERLPVKSRIEDRFSAWGQGRDFAIAAMHLGQTAAQAVAIANIYDTGCGNGVDVLEL